MPLFAVDENPLDPTLREHLERVLDPTDDIVVLPGASFCEASQSFKNVVVQLDGNRKSLPSGLFGTDWMHGISAVRVPREQAEALLSSPEERARLLQLLVDAIPNELRDHALEVGPALDVDNRGRDLQSWTAGFDSHSCCCGLYSAEEVHAPLGCQAGTERVHTAYYLVAKAGAGMAAQEFASRFNDTIKSGASLDEVFSIGEEELESAQSPTGAQGALTARSLLRLRDAGTRNRARIIGIAAATLGLSSALQDVPDHANSDAEATRRPVLLLDAVANSLLRVDASSAGYSHDSVGKWRYCAGAIDCISSRGAAVSSNVADGLVAFMSPDGAYDTRVRNRAFDALPLGSRRRMSTTDAMRQIADAYRQKLNGAASQSKDALFESSVHPDAAWLHSRFGWSGKGVPATGLRPCPFEPTPLWGTHCGIEWLVYARELGVLAYRAVHLRPQLVALAGVEAACTRTVIRDVSSAMH